MCHHGGNRKGRQQAYGPSLSNAGQRYVALRYSLIGYALEGPRLLTLASDANRRSRHAGAGGWTRRAPIDCQDARLPGLWMTLRHSAIRQSLRHSLKVDISALHIRADQLHAEPVADVQALKTALQSSFNGRMQKTDPRAFVRCASDHGIELLSDP